VRASALVFTEQHRASALSLLGLHRLRLRPRSLADACGRFALGAQAARAEN